MVKHSNLHLLIKKRIMSITKVQFCAIKRSKILPCYTAVSHHYVSYLKCNYLTGTYQPRHANQFWHGCLDFLIKWQSLVEIVNLIKYLDTLLNLYSPTILTIIESLRLSSPFSGFTITQHCFSITQHCSPSLHQCISISSSAISQQ